VFADHSEPTTCGYEAGMVTIGDMVPFSGVFCSWVSAHLVACAFPNPRYAVAIDDSILRPCKVAWVLALALENWR